MGWTHLDNGNCVMRSGMVHDWSKRASVYGNESKETMKPWAWGWQLYCVLLWKRQQIIEACCPKKGSSKAWLSSVPLAMMPESIGIQWERWAPLIEGVNWLGNLAATQDIHVSFHTPVAICRLFQLHRVNNGQRITAESLWQLSLK